MKKNLNKNLILSLGVAFAFNAFPVFAEPMNTQAISLNHPPGVNATARSSLSVPPAPTLQSTGYVLMDAHTGSILAQVNMNERMAPASLTKIMTLYLTFQALESGQIKLTDPVRVSEKAWRMEGSRMFLPVGTLVTVEDLIQGVVVTSGNDACVALAEHIAGTEEAFANLMDQTALRLGMQASHYVDSTGMPDPNHYSTPYDMALLTRAIINDFPQYYHYFGQKWFYYNNIKQPNRNRLLWRDSSVDGLKTGHTESAGFCLVSSAKREDMRLIAVIMGSPSDNARADSSQALLNYGFHFYKTYKLFDTQQVVVNPKVWFGTQKNTPLGVAKPVYVTIPDGQYPEVKASVTLNPQVNAPLIKGQAYGQLNISLGSNTLTSAPLIALQNNPEGGLFSRVLDKVHLMFNKK